MVGWQTLRSQGAQLKVQQKQLSNQQSQFGATIKAGEGSGRRVPPPILG